MNTPNPLIPQGSLDSKKSKSNIRIVVFGIVAVHAVFFVGLLMQGCKPDEAKPDPKAEQVTARPTLPLPPITEPTNPPVTPTNPVVTAPPLPPVPVEPVPAPVPAGTAKEYTIVKGDYFEKIAKANGVTIAAIEKANPGVDPKKLKLGQKIQIPAAVPKAVPTSAAPDTAPAEVGGAYAVKSGDTLTKIATANGTTVKALRAANDLKTDKLKVGQKLKLPAKAAASATPAPAVAPIPTEPATPTAPKQ
jgi:LysM repeat protein